MSKRKNPIVNTAEQVSQSGMYVPLLVRGLQGRHPEGFIEGMEAEGQKQLASQKERLPARGSTNPAWEKIGVKFGTESSGDDLFRNVELPVGWTIKATDHSMWSDLLDEKGRKRAGIFYKAAFYDRSAHVSLTPRYYYTTERASKDSFQGPIVGVVKDCETNVYQSEAFKDDPGKWSQENHTWKSAYDKASEAAKSWLKEHYPDHDDVTAYW